MSTAVIEDIEIGDLTDLDLDWAWDQHDMPTWLSLEEAAALLHEPLAEVEAMYELLAGKDND